MLSPFCDSHLSRPQATSNQWIYLIGTFKDKTVFHWNIIGLAPEKPVLSYCGVADNTFHQFSIYKDNLRVLYEIDGWKCSTIYWCF